MIPRKEKYKAKNLIDVVIYRGSDALYGWVFDSLQAAGLKTRRHRAGLPAGGRGMADPLWRLGPSSGTSRRHSAGRTGAGRTGMMRTTRREFAVLGTAAWWRAPLGAERCGIA